MQVDPPAPAGEPVTPRHPPAGEPAASPAWPPPGPTWPPPGPTGTGPSGPWPVVAAVLVGIWAVAVTVGGQSLAWLVGQVFLVSGLDRPDWLAPVADIGNALLVGVPAGLLAFLPRSVGVRATGRVWLLGAVVLGVLGPLRAIPLPRHEVYLAALAVGATAAALLVRRIRGNGRAAHDAPAGAEPHTGPASTGPTAVALAVAAGSVLLLPWMWAGALGGPLETVLAVVAAASVGGLAGTVLDRPFWAAFRHFPGRSGGARLVLLGGLVAGVALTLLAAGIGQDGTRLAMLLVLPPAGFVAAALWSVSDPRSRATAEYPAAPANLGPAPAGGYPPARWLVGLATAGPLAFVDPEEITLLLATGRDVPFWTVLAAAGSLAAALLTGAAYGVAFGRATNPSPRRWVAALAAVGMLTATGAVYLGAGQPGYHGDRIFVVMRQQADLSGIPVDRYGPAARETRGREVYQRLVATADRSQRDLRRQLDRLDLDYTPYYLVNAIEVDGGPAIRTWLSQRDDVGRVLLSQRVRPLPAAPRAARGGRPEPSVPGWNIRATGADRVWSELGVDGSGIVVGSSDSGVDGAHPALAAGFRGGADSWHDPWNGTRSPRDTGGHGTHTLGTAVGDRNVGVAPGAKWVGCVNLDRNLGNPARYLDCLQFMLAPFPPGADPFTAGRPERAPQVLTNSWGCPPVEGCDAKVFRPATAGLAAAGIFVVVAAGNTGPFCGSADDPPAPYGDVFTVGAVDRDRVVTDFSSRGPTADGMVKPDLVAPGTEVLSAMPGGGYDTMQGTSMATPHVAGAVALMWSAEPDLIGDLAGTRLILQQTAAEVTASYRSRDPADACGRKANITGAGLVDAYAAVRAARR